MALHVPNRKVRTCSIPYFAASLYPSVFYSQQSQQARFSSTTFRQQLSRFYHLRNEYSAIFPGQRYPRLQRAPHTREEECVLGAVSCYPPSSNEDNPREFRALINRASTEAEMCVAALIIESARMFHGTQELMTCRYGIQKGKRKLEKKMLRMVTEICGSVHDEKYDRLYQEHFPFGPMPQGRLYARLYDLNNLIGCRGRNPQRSRRSWVLGHGRR